MTKRAPTRASIAGQTYLALRQKARADQRSTDELLQLHALEAFIDRLATTPRARSLVLKGGALLAAYAVRRPTHDVDLSAQHLDNRPTHVRDVVAAIAAERREDGWIYETLGAETIREGEDYSGVRVTVVGRLATARVTFHVDVSVGDVVWPAPVAVQVPRLLGGHIAVAAYPLPMIFAEKIVTALQRGIANTRWRDFADVYLLSGMHAVRAAEVGEAIRRVAAHRGAPLVPLSNALEGFTALAAPRWASWVRKQKLGDRVSTSFDQVLPAIMRFADPMLESLLPDDIWDPATRSWSDQP